MRNSTAIDTYEDNLQKEAYDMSIETVARVQDCMAEIKEFHKLADSLLEILKTIEKKITRSYCDIAALALAREQHFHDLKTTGKKAEISGLPATNVEMFKNGTLRCVEVRGQGALATLKAFDVVIDVNLLEE